MMKTRDCVKSYVSDMLNFGIASKYTKANSCEAIGRFFVSYNTPIAKFCGDHFEVAKKKYSVTTSKQQNYLRFFIPTDMLVEVDEIVDSRFPFARR